MSINGVTKMDGRVRIAIVDHLGNEVHARSWQRNLILDAGLNRLADVSLQELFAFAVKGNDADPMKEAVAGSNNFSLNTVTHQITRTAGTRDFTAADIGKLVRSDTGIEAIIESISSVTVAVVRGVGLNPLVAYTNKDITLYSVQKVGLDTESERTDTYSSIVGENSTTTAAAVRTLKRTFLFPPEDANVETVVGTTVTWSGTTVVRTGPRDFTDADEGKYIQLTGAEYAKITNRFSASTVTVDRTPAVTRTDFNFSLHGFNSYSHIGFSDLGDPGDNLNILVRLENGGGAAVPVMPLGENPETPGQQVKVTYELTATFGPVATASASALISDPTSVMSGSKAGNYVLEAIGSSTIRALDGGGDTTSMGLEPCAGGSMALSNSTAALVPVGSGTQPDRSPGAAVATMSPLPYTADEFSRLVEGTFEISEAVGTNWRTMGIYDPDANRFLFTFLFNNNQNKPATHQLTLRFRKSWDRDLS